MYDCFYGMESEQVSFYRIPKVLFTDERFKGISAEAKVLYGLLLDRMALSAKNGWMDKNGRVYIAYTIEDIMDTPIRKPESFSLSANTTTMRTTLRWTKLSMPLMCLSAITALHVGERKTKLKKTSHQTVSFLYCAQKLPKVINMMTFGDCFLAGILS